MRAGPKVYPRGAPLPAPEEARPDSDPPSEGKPVAYQRANSRFMRREGLLFAIAAAAAIVLLNHGNLYLAGPLRIENPRIEAYVLVTAVAYLFLRFLVLAVEMRPTRVHADLVRCPECGQWLDDRTAAGLEAHRRIELTPKPTEKSIISAVALRRAVDAARLGPDQVKGRRPADAVAGAGQRDDLPGDDVLVALNDPDFLARSRHGPPPREERRLKR